MEYTPQEEFDYMEKQEARHRTLMTTDDDYFAERSGFNELVEDVALFKKVCEEYGRDFDTEFNAIKDML